MSDIWGAKGEKGKGAQEQMHLQVVQGRYSTVKQHLQFCIQRCQFANSFASKHKDFKWICCCFCRNYSLLGMIKEDNLLLEEKRAS